MTAESPCRRNICVPDACSLLFSAQVELEGKEILEWILDGFQVYISTEVKYECFQNIKKGNVVLPDSQKFKREISRKEVRGMDYEECLKYLEKYCSDNEMPKFSKLGDGEKHCTALSLYLSARFNETITLLIDDFDAIDIISCILDEQKFAIQKSVPDVLINLFKTNRISNENHVRGALQTYYNLMKKAVWHNTFKKRMSFNCRSFWIQNCGLRCS